MQILFTKPKSRDKIPQRSAINSSFAKLLQPQLWFLVLLLSFTQANAQYYCLDFCGDEIEMYDNNNSGEFVGTGPNSTLFRLMYDGMLVRWIIEQVNSSNTPIGRWEATSFSLSPTTPTTSHAYFWAFSGNYSCQWLSLSPGACGNNCNGTTITPNVSVSASPSNNITAGTSVTFTVGMWDTYQWEKNGNIVGNNSSYVDASLVNGDVISCTVTTSDPCASPNTATSSITMTVATPVNDTTSVSGTTTATCGNDGTISVNIAPSLQLSAVRYIRIQQNKNDYLHLAELRAIEVGTGNNVALNKVATSYSNWAGHTPGDLVDGNSTTLGHSLNAGTQEYLEVDLGAAYLIDRIEIDNRAECCQDRADNLLLILKDTAMNVVNSRQIDASTSITTTWNVTDVSWADGATILNRTGLAAGTYTFNYTDVNNVVIQESFTVQNSAVTPSVSIVSDDADNSIATGTSVTFTATPTNGGTTPSYQWKKNGNDVGNDAATYIDTALANNDVISVEMTSSDVCASPTTATSNGLTMTVGASVVGAALNFNTASDYVEGSNLAGINGASQFTFETWINPSSRASYPIFFSKGTSFFLGIESPTGLLFRMSGTSSPFPAAYVMDVFPNDNAWYHVAVVFDGTQTGNDNRIKFYIDGVLKTLTFQNNTPATLPTTSDNFRLGAGSGTGGSSHFYGSLDEVRFWSRALTQCEILENMNCELGSGQTDLLAYYNFNQTGTTLTDSSGNSNNATLLNFALTGSTSNWISTGGVTSGTTCTPAPAPSVTIASDDADNSITAGTSVTFTATPTNGGTTPSYQWKKNGNDVGNDAATYTDAALANNDVISVVMTSSDTCASPATATSITMTVSTLISGTTTPTCGDDGTISVNISPSVSLSAVRYIRIQQNKNDYLHLAELRAIEVGTGNNVALNKVATSYSNWAGHTPGDLVDGNSTTLGHSANAGTQEFLEVDLGAAYLIDRIEIDNRAECCQDRADNLLLILKDASMNVVNSRQIDASTSITTTWNVTDVSWADGATTLNRTGLAAGTYTFNYTDVNNTTAQQSFTISSLPSPTLFNVTGDGGSSCDGTGVAVGLDNSETGVNYQLKRDGTDVGSPVAGTGAALSFGNQTISGNYTVVATHATSGCETEMTGSAAIIVESSNLTPSVTILSNDADNSIILGTSVTFTATPTHGGTTPSYQWKKNGNDIGTNEATYTDAALADNDVISVIMTSIAACASPTTATSNSITMTVIDPCAGITNRIYVTENGTGNGSSWVNATNNLEAAINNTCGATEVWVAAGTYKPNAYPTGCTGCSSARDYAFSIKDGVSVYGGFAGTETQLSERNIAANPTILSGDIGTPNNDADNCYHVVIVVSPVSGTGMTFNGFTVIGGKADGSGSITLSGENVQKAFGGGVCAINRLGATQTYSNNVIQNNYSRDSGGGIYVSNQGGGNLYISSNLFKNNSAYLASITGAGGGLLIQNWNAGEAWITNNVFTQNYAIQGGGAHSFFSLTNGAVSTGTHRYINNTFYANSSFAGSGGLQARSTPVAGQTTGSLQVKNNVFWENTSNGSTTSNSSSVFLGNPSTFVSIDVSYCILQANSSYANGTGVINNQDPLFTDAANGDFSLQAASPAINAGDSITWATTGLTTDLAGNARPNGIVDMGAYEYYNLCPSGNILYVDANVSGGTGDGSSWANAYSSLSDALALAHNCPAVTTVKVAAGTYFPTKKPFDNGSEMTTADDRDKTFHVRDGLTLEGGYNASTGARNIPNNTTTLSGDIGTLNNNTDNCYHVVLASAASSGGVGVTVDGFTITKGNADEQGTLTINGNTTDKYIGGGLCVIGGTNTLTNNTVVYNYADFGSGIFTVAGTNVISNNVISNNDGILGGGINTNSGINSLLNNTLSHNTAMDGGGVYLSEGWNVVEGNTIIINTASNSGGGIFLAKTQKALIQRNAIRANTAMGAGGGISSGGFISSLSNGTSKIINNVIANNMGQFGGGCLLTQTDTLINNTIAYNSADEGGGVASFPNLPVAVCTNNVFWGNTKAGQDTIIGADYSSISTTFSNNLLQLTSNKYDGANTNGLGNGAANNIFAQNPLFTSAVNGDYTLQAASPAINAGSDAVWTATGLTTDLAGNARPFGIVDMGAYENQTVVPVEMLYFTGEATENGNLLTWATATEENNAGFEVQQSTDARTFEKIGFVVGNGTTYEQQTYEFLDKNVSEGVTYYRLKQLDFNGKFEYSNIVSISNDKAAIAEMLLYPNPVKDFLTIENGEGTATVFNALGQPLQQFNITDTKYLLNTDDLPKGIYTLQIRKADGTAVVKQFVK